MGTSPPARSSSFLSKSISNEPRPAAQTSASWPSAPGGQPGGGWEVFVQIAGSLNAESTTATLDLVQDGRIVVSEKVPLAKGASPRLAFQNRQR